MEPEEEIAQYFKDEEWSALSNEERSRISNLNFTIDVFTPKEEAPINNIITNRIIKIEFDDTQIELSNESSDENDNDEADIEVNYCDNCKEMYGDYCLKCTMLSRILDVPVKFGVKNRAKQTLPDNILEKKSSPLGRNGIFALKPIPESVIFGPFYGLSIKRNGRDYSFNVTKSKNCQIGKEKNSNWMRHINLASHVLDQNLRAFQYKGSLYFQSIKQINKGEELLIFYGIDFDAKDGKFYKPPVQDENEDIYACVSCCLGFSAKEHLLNHKKKCTFDNRKDGMRDKIVYCSTCQLHLSASEFLNGHKVFCEKIKKSRLLLFCRRQLEVDLRQLKCPKCNYATNCLTALQEHYNGNEHQDDQTSPVLARNSSSQSSSASTRISISLSQSDDEIVYEDGNKKYKCLICEKLFSSRGTLTKHKPLHGEKKFTCQTCNRKFARSTYLKVHEMTHTGERRYFCGKCDYGAIYKNTLELHIKNVHFNDEMEKTYECNRCSFKTNGRSSFQRHSRMHLGFRQYVCDVCDKAFQEKGDLLRHKQNHSSEKNILCSQCEKTFRSNGALRIHVIQSHTEKPYQCDHCNYKCITKESLDQHMNGRHPDGGVDKKFKCTQCKYQTNDKGNLNKHINNHNGYRPFVCDICGKGFLLKNSLRIHVNIHTGQRNYKCDICGKAFADKQSIRTHITTHTGNKRLQCSQCDFQTNTQISLYDHIVKAHPAS